MQGVDYLRHVLLGETLPLGQGLTLTQPTLRQMAQYGEERYLQLVHGQLTGRPHQYMVELDDAGTDYRRVEDFPFFAQVLSKRIPAEGAHLFIQGMDFPSARLALDKETDQLVLWDVESGCRFGAGEYKIMCDYLCKLHGISSQPEYQPGNELMYRKLLERERRRRRRQREKKPAESMYANLISALVNSPEFGYDYRTVWELRMGQFTDAVARILKIKQYHFTMLGCYFGTVSIDKIDKSKLSWMGSLAEEE